MKKIMPLFLTIALIMITATTGVFADQGNGFGNNKNKQFTDIQGNWGQASIMKMSQLGLLEGYEDGTFRPNQSLNQAEAAVMLDRLVQMRMNDDEDVALDDDKMFTNVPGWAKKSVMKGVHHQYINMNRYNSSVQCDRLLFAVQLAKALELTPVPKNEFDTNPFNFKDRMLISDEDYGYLLALYNTGYLKGYPDGNFNPNFLINRAQMARLIDNILGDGEMSDDKTAPIWPANSLLTASGITANSVVLHWTPAMDTVGVTLYKITYNDGVNKEKIANTGRTTTITGLTQDRQFTFTVNARDAAGNWSTGGPWVKATTLEATETAITAISAITGEARVGVQLTAGTLTPSDSTATYQWMISDTVNGTYSAITGADMKKYTPVEANAGKFLKVRATGTGDFTGTVTSAATAAVEISFALEDAIEAINSAVGETQMQNAIVNYAMVLGLNLTDYNNLEDMTPVHDVLFTPVFTSKEAIKTIFDAAVAAQKLEEN